jgi:hypothetical protein
MAGKGEQAMQPSCLIHSILMGFISSLLLASLRCAIDDTSIDLIQSFVGLAINS